MSLFAIQDLKVRPDIVHEYPGPGVTPEEPLLCFKNVLAKPRKDRNKKDAEAAAVPTVQIGNDIVNIEAVRFQLRTQFDRNVVTHLHVQEQILDYLFERMGVDADGSVPHPVLLTECVTNPNYSRMLMAELMFECYGIPGLSYGVDSLFSYGLNSGVGSGLVVSCGYHATHVIPILNGRMVPDKLKYPVHVNAITLSRAEAMIHSYCSFAYDYMEALKDWALLEYYDQNVTKIQLPYNQTVTAPVLTAEQRVEKRKELSRRLVEINLRKREEKHAQDKEMLASLEAADENLDDEENLNFVLQEFELKGVDDMRKTIVTLRDRIARTSQKMNAAQTVVQPVEEKPVLLQPPPNLTIDQWVVETRRKRDEILDKKQTRKQRRQDLAKRRTAAAQERMRIISQLAKKEKGNDDFGMRDEDWDVYKSISRDGDSDSEAENEKLLEYEEVLKQHDATYIEPSSAPGSNIAEFHQLHLGVEKIRVPEVLFQPSIIGIQEAGLAGTIDYVLKLFPQELRPELIANICLTGGCANIPGFRDRLHREMQAMLPFQSTFNLSLAANPTLDGWKGAARFATTEQFRESLLTRQTYDECGGEYFKEHVASNFYYPTPSSSLVAAAAAAGSEVIN
ncbi:hypothetical protein pipiens_010793 [Culex pipiens pipiens]|uniref:Actin-related protein 5 n=1 Tax=Culex pipiens pipiens TaxID=38569 RepID=A0ABD1D8T6_CULPP